MIHQDVHREKTNTLRLSVLTDEIGADFSKSCEVLRSAGIRAVELRHLVSGRVPMCDASELREVKRRIDDEGLTVSALSPGLFKQTAHEEDARREMDTILRASCEFALRLGTANVLIFGFAKESAVPGTVLPVWALRSLEAALRIADDYGVKLHMEPEPICAVQTSSQVAKLQRVAGGNLGHNADPGNVAWGCVDAVEDLRCVAAHVTHLHIKDLAAYSTREAPVWVPVGDGVLNYAEVFSALQAVRYTGWVTLEPHLGDGGAGIRQAVRRVESMWHPGTSEQIAVQRLQTEGVTA